MVKARRLNHINLNVSDISRSLRFYQGAFGLEVAFWEGRTMVFLRSPGADDILTLCQAEQGDPIAGGGVSHFGFAIGAGNMDEVLMQVEQAGGRLLRRGSHDGTTPFAYLTDPDGYVIELGE